MASTIQIVTKGKNKIFVWFLLQRCDEIGRVGNFFCIILYFTIHIQIFPKGHFKRLRQTKDRSGSRNHAYVFWPREKGLKICLKGFICVEDFQIGGKLVLRSLKFLTVNSKKMNISKLTRQTIHLMYFWLSLYSTISSDQ